MNRLVMLLIGVAVAGTGTAQSLDPVVVNAAMEHVRHFLVMELKNPG